MEERSMRYVATSLLLFLGVGILPCRAQWTVFDPAVHQQQIISTAQEVAKFVEMIDNQLRQLKELEEEVATLHHYVDLFGNPGSVVAPSAGPLTVDLLKPEVGSALGTIVAAASPLAGMAYDGNGLFASVERDFQTPGGRVVRRQDTLYRPIAAIQDLTENYLDVLDDVARRRASLKAEIARTSSALAQARTDAEVQKLSGVLIGLDAALQGVDQEVSHASASALVQDIASRADEKRQIQARRQEAHAEFAEALDKVGDSFRLMTAPVKFPTK